MLELLLSAGADPNLENWFHQNALHCFCAHQDGPASVISMFVRYHVSIDAQSLDGQSALHVALGRGLPAKRVCLALVREAQAPLHLQDLAQRSVVALAEVVDEGQLLVPLLRAVSAPPDWIQNETASFCGACRQAFTAKLNDVWLLSSGAGSMLLRKHHCRHCGRIVCNRCSQQRLVLTKFRQLLSSEYEDQDQMPVRVCQLCYDVLSFRRLR